MADLNNNMLEDNAEIVFDISFDDIARLVPFENSFELPDLDMDPESLSETLESFILNIRMRSSVIVIYIYDGQLWSGGLMVAVTHRMLFRDDHFSFFFFV
jgi:hypothetical protein